MEDAPFGVTEEYTLGNLTEVKEDRTNVPAATGVLLRVQAASQRTSKDGSIKSVSLQLNIVEGITVGDKVQYQNKALFLDLPYWADTAIRTTPRYAGKNQAFLVPLKQFLLALGYDLASPPKLNDQFYAEIIGREVRGDIRLRAVRAKNPVTQQYEDVQGEYRNEVVKLRAA